MPFACPPLQLPKDVLSERIDVFAQRALFRMLKADPAAQADAKGMVFAVKTGQLAGIYKEDEYVPAMRAKKMRLGWWQLIARTDDAEPATHHSPSAMVVNQPRASPQPVKTGGAPSTSVCEITSSNRSITSWGSGTIKTGSSSGTRFPI